MRIISLEPHQSCGRNHVNGIEEFCAIVRWLFEIKIRRLSKRFSNCSRSFALVRELELRFFVTYCNSSPSSRHYLLKARTSLKLCEAFRWTRQGGVIDITRQNSVIKYAYPKMKLAHVASWFKLVLSCHGGVGITDKSLKDILDFYRNYRERAIL